jgi:phosphoglycolate phosphatase-like HAD superfamily hydrolase
MELAMKLLPIVMVRDVEALLATAGAAGWKSFLADEPREKVDITLSARGLSTLFGLAIGTSMSR